MEDFLQLCQKNLQNIDQYSSVEIVLGTEACDLDSVVASLVHAFLLHQLIDQVRRKIVLPVLNIESQDVKLRTEVTYFFNKHGISPNLFICRNHINLKKLHEKSVLSLILVDHNVLSKEDAELQDSVTQIIDHHRQDFEGYKNLSLCKIEMVGSCTTLVAEELLRQKPEAVTEDIAKLLYGTIILDTICWNEEAQRFSPKDKTIATRLLQYIPGCVDDEKIFNELQNAKFDDRGLSTVDIFRRDLKVVSASRVSVAICSISGLIMELTERTDLKSSLENFASQNNYAAIVIMSLKPPNDDESLERQIAVFSSTLTFKEQICKVLESHENPNLRLKLFEESPSYLPIYHQGNVAASRKVVLPLVRDFLKSNSNTFPPMSPAFRRQTATQSNRFFKTPTNGLSALGSSTEIISGAIQYGLSLFDSTPRAPQNSFVDDSSDNSDSQQHDILPTLNNRESVEKVERKREQFQDQNGSARLTEVKSQPFTPHNSVVENSFDLCDPDEPNVLNSEVLAEKLKSKSLHLKTNHACNNNGGCENPPCELSTIPEKVDDTNDSGWGDASSGDHSFENGRSPPSSTTEGRGSSLSHENTVDNIQQELLRGSLQSEIESAEKEAAAKEPLKDLENSEILKDCGTEKNLREVVKEHPLSDNYLSFEEENADADFEMASNYRAETVDFPDSPQKLKLLKMKSMDGQVLPMFEDEEEGKEWYGEDDEKTLKQIENTQSQKKERPSSLSTGATRRRRKICVNPDILSSDGKEDDEHSFSSLSNKSDGDVLSPVEDLATPDDVETPDELEDVFEKPRSAEPIPEFSAAEEYNEERSWKSCVVGGVERKIDMKVIEPYKKVLSHGGYFGPNRNAIILFSACYLPDRSRKDYDYVMDNLFLYVLTTLDQLVAEDYVLIYLHGATRRSNMPSFSWLKKCYYMIDRRLRKNLKGLYLVHPTFWVKTIVVMTRPFISSKFARKLKFVNNLKELAELIPMDHVCIPDKVKQFDEERTAAEA